MRHENVETKKAPIAAEKRFSLLQTLAVADADSSVAALEQVKARGLRKEELAIVQQAWTTRQALLQHAKTSTDRRAVEVALADILLQARINGLHPQDGQSLNEMRTLLITAARQDFSHAALQAISALSSFDDQESVTILGQLARGNDDNKVRAAVVGLAYMCHRAAGAELKEIARQIPSKQLFVIDQLEKGESLKKETAQCERRTAILKAT